MAVKALKPLVSEQPEDFVPGDPAVHVLGRMEQPARRHRPLPPKPGPTARTILADVRYRMAELEGIPEEVARLERALNALKDI